MCDDNTLADVEAHLASRKPLSRRDFGLMAAAAGVTFALPLPANATEVTESDVMVATPDGNADCYFVHPSIGTHPGVIIWPDILGLRPAFRMMAKRLAQSGYAVLVVNPYYRQTRAPVVEPGDTFRDQAVRDRILPLRRAMSPQTNDIDAVALAAFLDASDAVDPNRKISTMGYCMGGPITMRTAAILPERIGAGASFHGGGLVTDNPDSPHLLVPRMTANFLIAVAENDDERAPDAKHTLAAAFDEAGLSAEIEVYEGALHGWCPPDSPVYNADQAEHAWSRLLALFERSL